MNETSRRPRSTAAERAGWRRRFLQSGLSQCAFAVQHGLKLSTLQRWVASIPSQSIDSPSDVPVFAQVSLPVSAASSVAPVWVAELIRPEGSTLRVSRDVSAPLLKLLLRSC